MTKLILVIFAIIFVAIVYTHGFSKSKRELGKRFENREALSNDDFYDRFYRSSGIDKDLICALLDHVAAELTLPGSKLLPSDRFDTELAPARGWDWSSGHGILASELKRWASQKKAEIDTSKIATLDDYFRVAASVY